MLNENVSPRNRDKVVENHLIAIVMVIFTEVLFFSGLLSTFIVFKQRSVEWPPVGQPRLPIYLTGLNTLVLLISFITFRMACFKDQYLLQIIRKIGITLLLGSLFLFIQGYEWVSLLNYGLRFSNNIYGAFFYMLIGAHSLHVLVGIGLLAYINIDAYRESRINGNILILEEHKFYKKREVVYLYWMFVVFLWPVLYFLLYF